MKRILYLAEDLTDGGTAKHVCELVPRLRTYGFEAVIWSRGLQGHYAGKLRSEGVEVVHETAIASKLLWAAARREYDLVHSCLYGAHVADAVICALVGQPFVKSTRNNGHWNTGTARIRWQVALRAKLVRHHVANSSGVMEYLVARERISAAAIHVIPNGIEDRVNEGPYFSRAEFGFAEQDFVMVSLAWLKPRKYVEFLIATLPQIRQLCHGAKLLIVGNGPLEEELKRKARDLGVADACVFVGRQSAPHALLRFADIMVSASPFEGMSNALLEAQMMGVPAIVTAEAAGNKEVIKHGVNGLLYPAFDAKSFTESVTALALNPYLRSVYSNAARQTYESAFSIDVQVRQYAEHYTSILGAASRAAHAHTDV